MGCLFTALTKLSLGHFEFLDGSKTIPGEANAQRMSNYCRTRLGTSSDVKDKHFAQIHRANTNCEYVV